MNHAILDGIPPAAFGVEEDDFQARKQAARPPVLDDTEITRAPLKDPTEDFAPWTIQHAKIPESTSPLPMMIVLLALWAMAFYAFAYWLSGPH